MDQTSTYPPIEDHGLIGDLQTAALVTTDGSIDWFCCPGSTRPACSAPCWTHERGGHFRVAPARQPYTTKQLYFPDTAILITRFMTEDGVGEVVDFMPPAPASTATDNHRLVRMMRCVRGQIDFEVDIAPRFDYGRQPHETHVTEHGAVFAADGTGLTLHAVREPERRAAGSGCRRPSDGDVHVTADRCAPGRCAGLVLESAPNGPPREIAAAEFERLFDETARFWRSLAAPVDLHRPVAGDRCSARRSR